MGVAVSTLFSNLECYQEPTSLDEEREIRGRVHRGLQNPGEDAVSVWCVAGLDLGLTPSQLLPSCVTWGRIGQSLKCPDP